MSPADTIDRWLPVNIHFAPAGTSVRWLNFRTKSISEPFFHQTVKALRSEDPGAQERSTSLGALLEAAASLEPVQPAGIIFHISRCGSTLLANALRAASSTVVLSEPRVVGMLFRPELFHNSAFPQEYRFESRKLLLNAITTLYGHSSGATSTRLVLKCFAVHLLQIRFIQRLWPGVPCLVMVRKPEEVIASNLARQAGWVRWQAKPRIAKRIFGWNLDVSKMSTEEYCARAIGRYCETALQALNESCKVIDYDAVRAPVMPKIAQFFGVEFLSRNPALSRALSTYSKDVHASIAFEDDRPRKRQQVTRLVSEAVNNFCVASYSALIEKQSWKTTRY